MSNKAPDGSNAVIETASGVYIDLAEPSSGDVRLCDLAHHLAQVNRYAGACRRPYSVAEHAVLTSFRSQAVGDPWETVMLALHHDDPEAYLHDITRPLKMVIGPLYRPVDKRMDIEIHASLGLPMPTDVQELAIKAADNWALSFEAYRLMPSKGKGWWCDGIYSPFHKYPLWLDIPYSMPWDVARTNYIQRHRFIEWHINEESK
jgi:hypothetical protein